MASEQRVLIHFDDLVMKLSNMYRDTMDVRSYSPRDIMSAMQGIHPVDAVEVVRCKDCKWAEYGKDYEPYCNHWKSGLYANIKDDDFCSYGERRTVSEDGK